MGERLTRGPRQGAHIVASLLLAVLAARSLAGAGRPKPPATPQDLHAALKAVNPNYTGKAKVTVHDGRIVRVDLRGCRVADLAPLKGMRLEGLGISGLALRDLSPIDDMPLRTLAFSPDKLPGRLDRLRRHRTLGTIGLDRPLAEARIPAARVWLALDAARPTLRLAATLAGHRGPVHAVAVSDDGAQFASGGADGTVRLWDAFTGECTHVLRGHKGAVRAVAYVPHPRGVCSAGDDGTARIWDESTAKCLHSVAPGAGPLTSLTHCVCCGPITLGTRSGRFVEWAPDARDARQAVVVPPARGARPIRFLGGPNYHYFASADGSLAVRSFHGCMALRTFTDGKRRILCGTFARPGAPIISGGDRLLLWDYPTRRVTRVLDASDLPILCIDHLSYDDTVFATGSKNGAVALWSAETGRCLGRATGHRGAVHALALADRETLVTAGADGTIRIWTIGPPDPIEAHRLDARADQQLADRVRKTMVSVNLAQMPFRQAVAALRDLGRVDIVVDAILGWREAAVTLRADGLSFDQALTRIVEPLGLRYIVRDGAILITTPPPPPKPKKEPDGFADEPEPTPSKLTRHLLWPWGKTLDASTLHGLAGTVSLDVRRTPLPAVLRQIGKDARLAFIVDTKALERGERRVTLQVARMRVDRALRWVGRATGLVPVWVDGAILFAKPDRALAAVGRSRGCRDVLPVRGKDVVARLAKRISLDFQEVPISEVVTFVGNVAKVPVILDIDGVRDQKPTVTIWADDVPTDQILRLACHAAGLVRLWVDDTLFVTTPARAEEVVRWETTWRERRKAPGKALAARLARPISFDFLETPAHDVFSFASSLLDTTIVLDPEPLADRHAAITLKMSDVPGEALLRWATRLAGLGYLWWDHAFLVTTTDRARQLQRDDREWRTRQQLPDARLAAEMQKPVLFDFVETPLQDVVRFLDSLVQASILVDPQALADAPTVTLKVNGVPRAAALRWVCRVTDLVYVWHEGALLITKSYVANDLGKEFRRFQAPPTEELAKRFDEEVALFFHATPLADATEALADDAQVPIVLHPETAADPPPVTLRVRRMRLRHALWHVTHNARLTYVWQKERILVAPPDVVRGTHWWRKLELPEEKAVALLAMPIPVGFVKEPVTDVLTVLARAGELRLHLDRQLEPRDLPKVTLEHKVLRLDRAIWSACQAANLECLWLDGAVFVAHHWRAAEIVRQDELWRLRQRPPTKRLAALMAKPVTFAFGNASLRQAVAWLQARTEVPLTLDIKREPPPLTLKVEGMRLDHALRWICRATDLVYVWRNGKLVISSPELASRKPPKYK